MPSAMIGSICSRTFVAMCTSVSAAMLAKRSPASTPNAAATLPGSVVPSCTANPAPKMCLASGRPATDARNAPRSAAVTSPSVFTRPMDLSATTAIGRLASGRTIRKGPTWSAVESIVALSGKPSPTSRLSSPPISPSHGTHFRPRCPATSSIVLGFVEFAIVSAILSIVSPAAPGAIVARSSLSLCCDRGSTWSPTPGSETTPSITASIVPSLSSRLADAAPPHVSLTVSVGLPAPVDLKTALRSA
eukprot:scaffold39254_cov33-Phaeocystis_antarctica.AAC.1